MKKLHLFVIRSFIGPFIITLAVVIFIFLTQTILKYIDEIAGKGIDMFTFVKLLFYFCLNLLPKSLPLAILLSALMTFGNLGQKNELTAIKSSGISLIRIIAPVFWVVALIGIGSYFYNDIIVPKANIKAYSLLWDIRHKKPSFDLKEKAFYNGLPGYSIRIEGKSEEGDKIYGVTIYDHTEGKGNTTSIMADSGSVYMIKDGAFLVFKLFQGVRYSEFYKSNQKLPEQEFTISEFDTTRMIFDMYSFNLKRTPEEMFSRNRQMKDSEELNAVVDSLIDEKQVVRQSLSGTFRNFFIYHFHDYADSIDVNSKRIEINKHIRLMSVRRVLDKARQIRNTLNSYEDRMAHLAKDARKYTVEKYLKSTFAAACLVMFLIGAPIGAIIKKGGLGIPAIISVGFFILFYVLSMVGEKLGREGVINLEFGMWLANGTLLLFGLFFMNQARNDSSLFDKEWYNQVWKKLINKK